MASSIELYFYRLHAQVIKRFKLPFQESIEEINLSKSKEYKFNLPDDLFSYNKDKSLYSIYLYSDEEQCKFLFYVNKGENRAYIGLDSFDYTVYQLIIYDDLKHSIKQGNIIFDKLDTLGNKYRKRLTLINTKDRIVLDGESLTLNGIVFSNYNDNNKSTLFSQISAKFEKNDKGKVQKQFIVKKIEEIKENDNFLFIKENLGRLENFFTEFKNVLKSKNFILNFGNIQNKYRDLFNMSLPKINKDNDYINDICKKYGLTELKPFASLFLITIILKYIDIINIDVDFLSELLNMLENDLKNINLIDNIKMDEKIKILSTNFFVYRDCKKLSDLKNLKIKNLIFNYKSKEFENSILDKVDKFYKDFIKGLTEDSNPFFHLLQINSGTGYFKTRKVYTFDLTNLEMIKNHLTLLFPKTLTIYNFNKDIESPHISFFIGETGGIAIDENFLVPKDKHNIVNYDKKEEKISDKESDEIAMNIVLYLLHEYMGHKKFYSSDNGITSPKKIVRKNKLIELKYEGDFKKDDDKSEYILTSDLNKGDSGHFLELSYKKFNNKLITKILLSIKKKGKLINRPDLFTNSDDKLEKYVILKSIAEEKKIEFDFEDEMSIEDEITLMEKKIDIQKYIQEQKENEEEEKKKMSPFKKKKKGSNKNYLNALNKEEKTSQENLSENEDESPDEYSDEEEESKEEVSIKDKRMERILKKFKLKNDENLKFNVEKKMNEPGLAQEDINDLGYIYFRYAKYY